MMWCVPLGFRAQLLQVGFHGPTLPSKCLNTGSKADQSVVYRPIIPAEFQTPNRHAVQSMGSLDCQPGKQEMGCCLVVGVDDKAVRIAGERCLLQQHELVVTRPAAAAGSIVGMDCGLKTTM